MQEPHREDRRRELHRTTPRKILARSHPMDLLENLLSALKSREFNRHTKPIKNPPNLL
jgi:hypothetical protein